MIHTSPPHSSFEAAGTYIRAASGYQIFEKLDQKQIRTTSIFGGLPKICNGLSAKYEQREMAKRSRIGLFQIHGIDSEETIAETFSTRAENSRDCLRDSFDGLSQPDRLVTSVILDFGSALFAKLRFAV
jgi:hypothetical protein